MGELTVMFHLPSTDIEISLLAKDGAPQDLCGLAASKARYEQAAPLYGRPIKMTKPQFFGAGPQDLPFGGGFAPAEPGKLARPPRMTP